VPWSRHSANLPPLLLIAVAPNFFLLRANSALGKGFAECPIKNTRQTRLCRVFGCRVAFAVGGTRQTLCRVQLGLCRVPKPRNPVVRDTFDEFSPPSNQTGHWVVIAKPKGREIQALKVTQNMAVYQELSCTVKVRRGIYTLNLRYIILEIPLPIWNISEIFQVRSLFRGGWSIPIIHCFKITLLICPCWPRDRLHTFRDLETFTAVFTLDAWDCDQSINYLLWCAERGLVCMNCQASPTVHIPDLQKHVTRQRRAGDGNSTANTWLRWSTTTCELTRRQQAAGPALADAIGVSNPAASRGRQVVTHERPLNSWLVDLHLTDWPWALGLLDFRLMKLAMFISDYYLP